MESTGAKRAALVLRLGAVIAGCAVVVGMAVTGHNSMPTDLQFVQVGHWVYNNASQAAVHVDGATGQVDAQASIPGAAEGSPVTQGARSGYVVDRSRITEFSKSTLGVENSLTPPATEPPVVLEVPGGPYLVYRNTGQIARLGDPAATVPAGGPLSAPVSTSDGTVWLHRIDNGAICDLPREATLLTCPAQLPQGHNGLLAVVADQPVVLDTTVGTISFVGRNGLGDAAGFGLTLPATVQVANSDVDGRLAVVDPGQNQLHLIDAAGLLKSGPAVRPISVALAKDGRFTGPVATSHTVALVDQVHNVVLTYDSKGSLESSKPVPGGADGQARLTLGQDSRIYVDNHDGSHVVVVDGRNGSAADVNVDEKARTQSAPPAAPPAPPAPPAEQQHDPVPARPPVETPVAKPTRPGAPRNVRATASGSSVTVRWSGAADNGARIQRYVVSWSGGSATVDGSRTSTSVGDLAGGQSYVFTVAAENSAGRGAGASSSAVTLGGAASAPKVTASVGSGGKVSVSWTQPNLRGADLDHYVVSASGQDDRDVSSTSASYQGLSGAVTFTVRAVTSYGSGASFTGAAGTATVTVAAGPPTVKFVSAKYLNGITVTVDADGNGAAATCQASNGIASSGWVACDGTTVLDIPGTWIGSSNITVTIKTSAGTGKDSWSGTPS